MLTSQQTRDALRKQYTEPIFRLLQESQPTYQELQSLVNERNMSRFSSVVGAMVDRLGYEYSRNKCNGWVELKWPKRRVIVYMWEHFGGDKKELTYVRYVSELHVTDNPETTASSAQEACAIHHARQKQTIEDRRDWLYSQYGLSIENDAEMRRMLDSYARDPIGSYPKFADYVGKYMREIRGNFYPSDVFDDADYKFLQVTLWDYLDGDENNSNYLVMLAAVNNQLSTLPPTTLAELEKDTTMNDQNQTKICGAAQGTGLYSNVPVKTVTYIFGRAVGDMSTQALIDAVKQVEAEIAALSSVKTKSAKIETMIADLNTALAEIVKALDAS